MLAIIIPYYKLTFFEATLQSLASQTDKRFKLYIGDDGSPQDCSFLVQLFKNQFDLKYHRFESNIGRTSLIQQWERCIALSENEDWLMILGDDDVLESNVVAAFYQNLFDIDAHNSQIVRYASRYIDENQKPLKGYADYLHPKLERSEDSFYRNFLGHSRSSLSEYIFSRTAFQKFGFHNYPLAWHTDDRAWLEFAGKKAIYSINEAFVEIRVTSESITGRKDNGILKQIAKIQFYEFIVNHKQFQFNKKQKENLLLEYGLLIQSQEPFPFVNVCNIFLSFIKLASLYNALRFSRRVVKAQFKKQ